MPSNSTSEAESSDKITTTSAVAATRNPSSPNSNTSNHVANDATIAQCVHAMQQLTGIFQFTPTQAQDAIDAVGPDVTLAYNYILDNVGEDKGGTIIPIDNCCHLQDCLKVDAESFLTYGNACGHYKEVEEQPYDVVSTNHSLKEGKMKGDVNGDGACPSGENWLCLTCARVRCSRYVNGHCKEHWESTKEGGNNVGHCVAVSLEDLSVWCYECSAYLNHPSLKPFLKQLEENKFRE
jgi:hypothetical protein